MIRFKWLKWTPAALLLAIPLAWAGERREPEPVVITPWPHGGSAVGALGEVRHSSDASQYIRCWIGPTQAGGCEARSLNGGTAFCTFADVNTAHLNTMRDNIRAISAASQVRFTWAHSNCTSVTIRSSSRYAPPRP